MITRILGKKYSQSYGTGGGGGGGDIRFGIECRACSSTAKVLATDFDVGKIIDGVTLAIGNRVVIAGQADAKENGIYKVNATGTPNRDETQEHLSNRAFFVTEGTVNGDKIWACINDTIVYGTTAIQFTTIGLGLYTAGNGLILVGNQFALATATEAQLLVADDTSELKPVAMSGEATIDKDGIVTIDNDAVIAKTLTGFSSTTGVVSDSDTILSAIEKIDGNLIASIPTTIFKQLTILSDGDKTFTLDTAPTFPTQAKVVYNHCIYERAGIDYDITGTQFDWLEPDGVELSAGGQLTVIYDDVGGGCTGVSSFNTRTGDVMPAAGDYTKSDVGLSNADNTSDADKPISTAVGIALNGKEPTITTLPIVKGGTNSGTALTNGKVMQSLGGKIVESGVDIASLTASKSVLIYPEFSANYNNRRVRAVSATGNYRLNFYVPKHFTGTLTVKIIGYPVSGAGGTGKNIDLTGEYTLTSGASSTQYTFSDITSTYNTGTDDTRMELNITSLFTNLVAGAEGGVLITHVSIGGTINYIGIEVSST